MVNGNAGYAHLSTRSRSRSLDGEQQPRQGKRQIVFAGARADQVSVEMFERFHSVLANRRARPVIRRRRRVRDFAAVENSRRCPQCQPQIACVHRLRSHRTAAGPVFVAAQMPEALTARIFDCLISRANGDGVPQKPLIQLS